MAYLVRRAFYPIEAPLICRSILMLMQHSHDLYDNDEAEDDQQWHDGHRRHPVQTPRYGHRSGCAHALHPGPGQLLDNQERDERQRGYEPEPGNRGRSRGNAGDSGHRWNRRHSANYGTDHFYPSNRFLDTAIAQKIYYSEMVPYILIGKTIPVYRIIL